MPNKIDISLPKQKLIIYIILALVTFAVFGQVCFFDFVSFDDSVYVTGNPHIKAGITLEAIRWAFSTTYAEFWHPLTWLSLMLDHQLFGLNAGGYHLTNLVFHILSTLLLFWLFNRMTGALWRSTFVAAFFALHPLHVESVAWIAERKDVLSAFFWMLTLCLYVYYTENQNVKRYLLVVFSFVCGLMSKSMVVTLPVIMILLDYWPLKRFEVKKENLFLWQLKEKMPFFVLSAIFSVITFYAQYKPAGRDLQFSLTLRLANALVSFTAYLEKTFLPVNLAAFYPFPDKIPALKIIAAGLLMLIISFAVIKTAKRLPYLFAGWAWYAITILPVIGIMPIGDFAMADRYHYIPSIGIAVMLAWGVPALIKNDALAKKFLFAAGISFLLFLAVLSFRQSGYWKNDITLFNRILQVTKNNYVAHINLGSALVNEGKIEEGIIHYNEAVRIMPDLALSYDKRAAAYAKLGRHQEAFEDLNRMISMKPDYTGAYLSRGTIYQQLGRHQNAVDDFSEFIRLKPDDYSGYFNRGNAYINLGQFQKALDDFHKAVALNTKDAAVYNNRAFIYLNTGRYQQAFEDYSKAISLKPDYADAYNNRAFVLLSQGSIPSGCADAKKACELKNCATLNLANSKGLCP
jgi:tetratricopeptide (TPR) repeat protein